MTLDLLFLSASFLFAAWVVFFGGASTLEDTIKSEFLIHPGAINWSATGIKLYVGLGWVGCVVLWLFSRLACHGHRVPLSMDSQSGAKRSIITSW